MKILYIVNLPAPYMVNFLNELGKLSDLTAVFEKSDSSERDKSWQKYNFLSFRGIVLKGIPFSADSSFSPQVISHIKKNVYDSIIVANPTTPTGIIAMVYMNFKKIPYSIRCDGGFAGSQKGLKEYIKKKIFRSAVFWLSTAVEADNYLLSYGAKKDTIFRYPLSTLYAADILSKPLSTEQKKAIRKDLHIEADFVILSVGQFIYRKGFDVLLDACKNLKKDSSIAVYIIGGEPTKSMRRFCIEHQLKHVTFLPFMLKDQLQKYYQAADVFVFPTREDIWGLVINEAMANGLPIISTNRCIAGLELVVDDENGYIVPVNNADAIALKINRIVENQIMRLEMAQSSLDKIRHYTLENMAKMHMEILEKYREKRL